jgi:hypothetical protein
MISSSKKPKAPTETCAAKKISHEVSRYVLNVDVSLLAVWVALNCTVSPVDSLLLLKTDSVRL